jgi:VCBS repeat-containing protein
MSLKHQHKLIKSFLLLALAAFGHNLEGAIAPPSSSLYTITLGWDAVPETNIQGYRIFVGTETQQYTRSLDTGLELTFPVDDLEAGETYYFTVRAVSTTGVESVDSQELVVTVLPQPVAVADSYSTPQGTPLIVPDGGVLTNDTDMDSAVLTAVLDQGPQHGHLTLRPEGGFTYTPAAGFSGTDSFFYHTSDGELDSELVEVSIPVSVGNVELIVNGSFESDFSGWITSGNQMIAKDAPYAATDGTQLVAFNGGNQAPTAVLSQSFATVPGATYTLEFDAGVLAYNLSAQNLVVSVSGGGVLLSESVTLPGDGTQSSQWQRQAFTFVADSTTSILAFHDQSTVTDSIDMLLDGVSVKGPALVDSVVPEVPEEPQEPVITGTPSLAGSPGNFTIAMEVQQAGSYVLERSEDLQTWEVVETKEITETDSGLLEFRDLRESVVGEAPPEKMFYRIGLKINDAPN